MGSEASATTTTTTTTGTSGASATNPAEPSIRQQLSSFWAMSRPYFSESGEGKCLFGVLVILMLLDSAARIAFSYLARDFWSALGDKDAERFYDVLLQFLVALCLLAPINVLYRFQKQKLAIRWREWMTERLLQLYFDNPHQIYYRLEQKGQDQAVGISAPETSGNNGTALRPRVDNPDQRLAEDVRSFTQYSLSLFLTIAISLIDLSAFSVVLYTIEPKLFASIVGFAALGTVATCLLGRDLVRLNGRKLAREADFRYSLVRLRENAESIAFFRGEVTEGKVVRGRFRSVVANALDVIRTQRNLEFFTVSYNYLTWILPVVVVAPDYMAGNVELGVVQQAAAAFGHILDDLSLVINEFEGLAEFSASITRLHQFLLALRDANPWSDGESDPLLGHPPSAGKDGLFRPSSRNDASDCVSLKELSPGRRALVRSLDLELQWGERLLIIGPSGIGKSSLLRAIAGLWTSGNGVIERANTSDVYFLPQRPYCPLGSLRDQLLYPSRGGGGGSSNSSSTTNTINKQQKEMPNDSSPLHDDPHLLEVLEKVDLSNLAKRSGDGDPVRGLDAILDWGNVLSLGEQQRLAFARVLVHEPRLVILDEATSAMDVSAEETMYGLLLLLREGTTTCVSVGHRPSLLQYHTRRLQLHKGDDDDNRDGDRDGDRHRSISNRYYTVGDIRSTAETVASDEVNWFFR
eukprot:jgi/Psemu1/214981/e_gw1.719.32.1